MPVGWVLRIALVAWLWAIRMSRFASCLNARTAWLVELARPLPALCNSVWSVDVYPWMVVTSALPVLGKLLRDELIAEFRFEIADRDRAVVGVSGRPGSDRPWWSPSAATTPRRPGTRTGTSGTPVAPSGRPGRACLKTPRIYPSPKPPKPPKPSTCRAAQSRPGTPPPGTARIRPGGGWGQYDLPACRSMRAGISWHVACILPRLSIRVLY